MWHTFRIKDYWDLRMYSDPMKKKKHTHTRRESAAPLSFYLLTLLDLMLPSGWGWNSHVMNDLLNWIQQCVYIHHRLTSAFNSCLVLSLMGVC